MRVEFLYWPGCPSHPAALAALHEALEELGIDAATIETREVATEQDADAERFVGSPTIRIDDIDVQPAPSEPFGLTCRIYHRRNGRFSPLPDPDDLRDALRSALKGG